MDNGHGSKDGTRPIQKEFFLLKIILFIKKRGSHTLYFELIKVLGINFFMGGGASLQERNRLLWSTK